MKITFERYDFAKGTVEAREREIDSTKVLAGNALFGRLKSKADAKADALAVAVMDAKKDPA